MLKALEKLDEHATRGARMKERDHALRAAPRPRVDELDPPRGEASERSRKIGDLEADVVHRRAAALGEEARDTRLGVGRLEQLDARLTLGEEHHLHALRVEPMLGADGVAEDVAIERDRIGDRGNDDTDVMQRPGLDAGHERRGSCTPNTPRSSSLSPPRRTPPRTASRLSGTRVALPFAAGHD